MGGCKHPVDGRCMQLGSEADVHRGQLADLHTQEQDASHVLAVCPQAHTARVCIVLLFVHSRAGRQAKQNAQLL